MFKFILIIGLFILSNSPQALVELNGEYGLDKTKYGANRQNKIEAEHMRGSAALYLFDSTALEINYSQSETITSVNNTVAIDDSVYEITGTRNRVLSYSYGIGVRQLFSSRKARWKPTLSIGYARQFIRDTNIMTVRNTSTNNTFTLDDPMSKLRYDSVFGTFALSLRITKRFSLRGSVNTMFRAFEFNKAQDNLRYMIGFSWFL